MADKEEDDGILGGKQWEEGPALSPLSAQGGRHCVCQVLSQSRDKVNKTDTGPAVSLEHGRQQEASKHGVLGRSEGSHTGSH